MNMKNMNISFFILALLFSFNTLSGSSVFEDKTIIEKIDEIVQAEVKYNLFSGTVLIAKDGEIIYAKGFGEANKDDNIPNTLETRFNISSVQKCFIATLIMQLHQKGSINIDDPLNKYFPDCPFETVNQIQIKHLLNHTSGLGDYRGHKRYHVEAESFSSISDVLPLVYEQQPTFNPGEKFSYSNTGVLFLKGIIEKVTGKKLYEVLKQQIFSPLDMGNTVLFSGGDLLDNRAFGYKPKGEKGFSRVLGEPAAYAGGGIYTTVLDLLKFDQALYGEELLSEENKNIMFTPVKPSRVYGYGWIVVPFGGTTVIYHGGASGGFSSEFRRYPEKGYTIITLSNYEGAAFEMTNKIDCMLLGLPYTVTTKTEYFYRLGTQYQRQEAYKDACQSYKTALEMSKNDKTAKGIIREIQNEINSIGYKYLEKKEYSKAIETFKINVINFPDSYNVYDSLAEAYMKKGNKELAIKNYQKALELNPQKSDREKKIYEDGLKNLNMLKK